jgi:alkylation response protein AidB-like acyl-CoA dehydrogenase
VEKIKRDVRITTIYEGTSEILEWTIARDRWQRHLKTRGQHYAEWARRLGADGGLGAQARGAVSPQGPSDGIHSRREPPDAAAETNTGTAAAALALRSLAALLERCRLDRLTRHQHVLFRLGEMIAWAETAAVFAERVASHPTRASALEPGTLATLARIQAREAALKVACEGLRWAQAAGQTDPGLVRAMEVEGALAVQAGLLDDMDRAARDLARAFPTN